MTNKERQEFVRELRDFVECRKREAPNQRRHYEAKLIARGLVQCLRKVQEMLHVEQGN